MGIAEDVTELQDSVAEIAQAVVDLAVLHREGGGTAFDEKMRVIAERILPVHAKHRKKP